MEKSTAATGSTPPLGSDEIRALRDRLEYLEFDARDADVLRAVHDDLERVRDECIDTFYGHLKRFPAVAGLLASHDAERLRETQATHFSSLTAGRYDADYFENRKRVGWVHQRVGLAPEWYLGSYRKYLSAMLPALFQASGDSPEKLRASLDSLLKVVFLDMGLALDAYFEADRREVDAAREQAEQAGRIFQATSLSVGEEFLETLCRELSRILGVSYAMVAVKEDQHPLHANSVVFLHQGRRQENFRYEIENSPCQSVLHKGVCVYPDGLQSTFPKDEALQQMSLESYAGIPLHGRGGEPLGVLAVFSEEPLVDPARAARLLEVFSLRAETELERQRIEGKLRLQRQVMEQLQSGVLIADMQLPDRPVVYVNPAYCAMTGFPPADVMGRTPHFLQGEGGEPEPVAELCEALDEGREVRTTLRSFRKDGSGFWSDVFAAPVRDEKGRITHLIGILSDISQVRIAQEKLAHDATHDGLTGLPNRALLTDRLQQAVFHAQSRERLVAVLFVDVDQFKAINDSWGHEVGDRLLVEIGRRMQRAVRAGDTVARCGSDEFAVVLGDMPDTDSIKSICAALREAVAQPFVAIDQELQPEISIGVAVCPRDSTDVGALCRFADMALSRAKDFGGANVQFYSSELNARLQERMRLGAALRGALRGEGVQVVYQPIVSMATGMPVGVEALARWTDPSLGVVPPDRFVPVAEETGLIAEVGRQVLRQSCSQLRRWLDTGQTALQVAVNVSPRQFREQDLIEQITRTLDEFCVPAELICLEITESVMLNDTQANVQTLRRLKDLGLSLVMDDFGTGYSSLSYLRRLPFDKLKIDRSFIREMATSSGDAALVRSIISMANDLGIAVVAEGVETSEQWCLLQQYGCDLIQGYLYSKPLPGADLTALLREGRGVSIGDG